MKSLVVISSTPSLRLFSINDWSMKSPSYQGVPNICSEVARRGLCNCEVGDIADLTDSHLGIPNVLVDPKIRDQPDEAKVEFCIHYIGEEVTHQRALRKYFVFGGLSD